MRSTCVLRIAFCVETSFIANADAVAVVVFHMCSNHRLRSARFYAAVSAYDIVIADSIGIASRSVPFVYLASRTGLIGFYCRTVDYQ